MIIKVILVLGLAASLLYALAQQTKVRWIRVLIAATSVAGMFFVLMPELTQRLADAVGVGRGADLVLYCWIVISLVVSINLQFRLLELQSAVTRLTRQLAIVEARKAESPRASPRG